MDDRTLEVSILTTTQDRDVSLERHLKSINDQIVNFNYEILVLDDYYKSCKKTVDIVNKSKHSKYIHTGKTKNGKDFWRVPGFALNIGAKLAGANILTITGCDVEILGNDSYQKVFNMASNLNYLVTVRQIKVLNKDRKYNKATRMPFFMTIPKETFFYIGGYDEDFIGVAGEDNDIMDRLMSLKRLKAAPIDIIHHEHENVVWDERRAYNLKLWKNRKGILIRNKDREWGKL